MAGGRTLENAAKAMVAAAQQGRTVLPILKKLCPTISRQIMRDGKSPGLLKMWGRSLNVDENVGATIVHPAILQAIGNLAGVPMRSRIVHAGLQHTYGYLFSLIETAYGAKRDRWVSDHMECGFGLERSLLGENPLQGTLLANVTWFLAQIVFRDDPSQLGRLKSFNRMAAPALVEYEYTRLSICRIVETVVLPGTSKRKVSLLTDLVSFPVPPTDRQGENTLLVYSAQNGRQSPVRLITAFPVRSALVRELRAAARSRGPVEVLPRYNAYVPGFHGKFNAGRRYLIERPPQN